RTSQHAALAAATASSVRPKPPRSPPPRGGLSGSKPPPRGGLNGRDRLLGGGVDGHVYDLAGAEGQDLPVWRRGVGIGPVRASLEHRQNAVACEFAGLDQVKLNPPGERLAHPPKRLLPVLAPAVVIAGAVPPDIVREDRADR